MVSGSQMMAAGFASAGAAFVTSRFGVAGTLLGAALTAMIITGGSAILRAYLESVTGRVRKMPGALKTRANRLKARRYAEPNTLPERPDLRNNFAGRMRAALDWFSHLPPLTRRSILIKGLIGAAVAFVIGMAAVYAVETGIGNSLSCGLWGKCPEGAEPGIHIGGDRGAGTRSSLSFARPKTDTAAPGNEIQNPAFQQEPDIRPQVPSGDEPGRGILEPEQPVEQEMPVRPEEPSTASPAPGGAGALEPEIQPPDASPAPSE